MTADSWKSFIADGPPQVGQDVLLHDEVRDRTQRLKWPKDRMILGFTHWTPFRPPAKEDGFEKWWKGFAIDCTPTSGLTRREIAKAAWTEATRQERCRKLAEEIIGCGLHPTSGMADPRPLDEQVIEIDEHGKVNPTISGKLRESGQAEGKK